MEMKHDFGGSNVVPLFTERQKMNFPAVSQMDAYWEALRDGRAMPERAEVNPRGLESALEFSFMLEPVAPGVGRFRIAGRHLVDLLGMEVRGMPISAFFEPSARNQINKVLSEVVKSGKVADVELFSDLSIGRPALTGRLYLAPLSNGSGKTERVLGCLQTDGKPGRAPRRFQIDNVHLRRIVVTAATAAKSHLNEKPVAPAFAEPQAIFDHAPITKLPRNARRLRDGAHLRLVKTDD